MEDEGNYKVAFYRCFTMDGMNNESGEILRRKVSG